MLTNNICHCHQLHSQKQKMYIRAFVILYGQFSEKAMAPHSSTLAWKIPWTEEPGGLQSMGSLSRARLNDFTFTFHFHALEKEMATHSSVLAWRIPGMGRAWWAAIYGVAQSRTRLKRLSSSSSSMASSPFKTKNLLLTSYL